LLLDKNCEKSAAISDVTGFVSSHVAEKVMKISKKNLMIGADD